MTLDPRSAREESLHVQCRLSNVVTWMDDDIVVWHENSICYGAKGIFPNWQGTTSLCPGPKECALLENRELFYPPDRQVWLPYIDQGVWQKLVSLFRLLDSDDVTDEVRKHILELQEKWGIVNE